MMRHGLTHTGSAADGFVAHLATLAKPGGHVYLVDVDLDATRTSPADADVQEQLDRYAEIHRHLGNDVRTGPRLDLMLRAAGFEVVEHRGAFSECPLSSSRAGAAGLHPGRYDRRRSS